MAGNTRQSLTVPPPRPAACPPPEQPPCHRVEPGNPLEVHAEPILAGGGEAHLGDLGASSSKAQPSLAKLSQEPASKSACFLICFGHQSTEAQEAGYHYIRGLKPRKEESDRPEGTGKLAPEPGFTPGPLSGTWRAAGATGGTLHSARHPAGARE